MVLNDGAKRFAVGDWSGNSVSAYIQTPRGIFRSWANLIAIFACSLACGLLLSSTKPVSGKMTSTLQLLEWRRSTSPLVLGFTLPCLPIYLPQTAAAPP